MNWSRFGKAPKQASKKALANDWQKFGDDFREITKQVRKNIARAEEKQQLVQDGQVELWQKLRTTAIDAVAQVNNEIGNPALEFHECAAGDEGSKFEIIFNPTGQEHKAAATFNVQAHAVLVAIHNPDNLSKRENLQFFIQANDKSQLEFAVHAVSQTPERVVERMLSGLL